MANLVTYVPRPQPTLGNNQLYLQQELAAIAGAGRTVTDEIKAIEGAWKTYTPTLTASSGTLTTASAAGRYLQMGKTIHVALSVTITTNGTAAGYVRATLPVASNAALIYVLPGRENTGGKMLQGRINAGTNQCDIFNYDNTYPGANGYQLLMAGAYEAS
jgi:hypothetical protein